MVRVTPPAALTAEVEIPDFEGVTNGDLFEWACGLRKCCERANIQFRALREWAENGQAERNR